MSTITVTTMMPDTSPTLVMISMENSKRVRERPAVLDGGAAHSEPRNRNPTLPQLKTRKG
jgi:hypothetical protein